MAIGGLGGETGATGPGVDATGGNISGGSGGNVVGGYDYGYDPNQMFLDKIVESDLPADVVPTATSTATSTAISPSMVTNISMGLGALVGFIASGGNPGGALAGGALAGRISKSFGLNETVSKAIAQAMESGATSQAQLESIAKGLTTSDFDGPGSVVDVTQGGTVKVGQQASAPEQTFDAGSYDFWKDFVTEWQGAKDMFQQDDLFKKKQAGDALGTYQKRLQGLTGEAQHQPITWGMGDFTSTFMPKSGKNTAKDILESELALTDIMQPNKGSMDYMTALQSVASQEHLAKLGYDASIKLKGTTEGEPDDKGGWLDVIADAFGIVESAGDAYDVWKK